MTDPIADLQFERAAYETNVTGVTCGLCKKPIADVYWQWLGRVACAGCKQGVHALEVRSRSPQTFARAAILGGATALGCGAAYAIFVGVTKYQLALLTIGIAYLVATVIRKASGNVSGLRFQVLAVVLTYMAGAMGYAPSLWRSMPEHREAPTAIHDDGRPSATMEAAPTPSGASLAKALGVLSALLLAAPFLEATHAPLGLLIIGFGLMEAWRRTRPTSMVVTGPYPVPTPGASPPP